MWRRWIRFLLLALWGAACCPILVAWSSPTALQQGLELYRREQFAAAVEVWQQALSQTEDPFVRATLWHYLAMSHNHLGQNPSAEAALERSWQLVQTAEVDGPTRAEILARVANTRGQLQWERGDYRGAHQAWEKAAQSYLEAEEPDGFILAQLNRARALQALGLFDRCRQTLEQVTRMLQERPNDDLKATGWQQLGKAHRHLGHWEAARIALAQSLEIARSPQIKSTALLELGNVNRLEGEHLLAIGKQDSGETYRQRAESYYRRASALATTRQTRLYPLLNALDLAIATARGQTIARLRRQIDAQLPHLEATRSGIDARLNYARSLTCLRPDLPKDNVLGCQPLVIANAPQWETIARIIATALQQAQQLEDPKAIAYGLGQLGGLYELTQQWQEAIDLTQKAISALLETEVPEIRYTLEWQLGRLYQHQGQTEAAIAAYTQATETLQQVQGNLLTVAPDLQFSFGERIEPVYRQSIDIMLGKPTAPPPQPEHLQRAIREIDNLSLAKLENYLGCRLELPMQQRQTSPEAAKVARIYTIILDDRLEVIAQLPAQPLKNAKHLIPREEFVELVEQTRSALLRLRPGTAIANSERLYQWLIEPFAADLQAGAIDTLEFILDDQLGNLPMGVLSNPATEKYLVEEYATVVMPNPPLFESMSERSPSLKVLGGGIAKAVQVGELNFSPLDVETELAAIEQTLPATEVLLDSEFTYSQVEESLQEGNFSVVHLATHGQFSSDPQETYLLLHSAEAPDTGMLLQAREMDDLLQQGNPLDLLVLSACETASGDRRAPLGLAGVALQSGAKATVATLWQVRDDATVALMEQFYRELAQPGTPLAIALQRARRSLLQTREYQNPFDWAPFVLVGDWQ